MFVLKKYFFSTRCTSVKKGVTLVTPIRTLYSDWKKEQCNLSVGLACLFLPKKRIQMLFFFN